MKKIIAKVIVAVMVITVVAGFAAPLFAADSPSLTNVYSQPLSVADPDTLTTMSPPFPPPIPEPTPLPPGPHF